MKTIFLDVIMQKKMLGGIYDYYIPSEVLWNVTKKQNH